MRFIETKTHGYLDYLMGILLLVAPALLDLDMSSAEGAIPMILGAMMIVYSLMTSYELGIAKVISMKTHLMIDLLSGIFLAASPWLFNFDERVYLPHLILGIAEILASLMTKTTPRTSNVGTTQSI
ncbi:MAG TPA: SPW repeat protein [Flavobacterium sp.]|jgi:hypothetical protein